MNTMNSELAYSNLSALLEECMPGDDLEASLNELFQLVSQTSRRGRFVPTVDEDDDEDWTDFDDLMQGNDAGDMALFRKSNKTTVLASINNNKQDATTSQFVQAAPMHRVDSTHRLSRCGRAA